MADDLNRWLRAVRPDVPADDGFVDTADGRTALEAIHARTDRRARPRRRATPRGWRPVLFPAAAIAAVAVTTLALTSSGLPPAPQHHAGPAAPVPFAGARPAAQLLDPYRSCDELLSGLRIHLARTVQPYGLPGAGGYRTVLDSAIAPSAPQAKGAEAGAAVPDRGTSTTNDQEADADEPDMVKTDGDRVITVTNGVLRVIDASTRTIAGTLDLTLYAGWPTAQLLVSGNNALVFLGGAGDYGGYGGPEPMIKRAGPYLPAGTPGTTVLFVGLAGQPRVTGSLHTEAAYLDARLIDGTVRMVTESEPRIAFPQTGGTDEQRLAANRAAVNAAPLSAWLPSYTVTDGTTTTKHAVPCADVSHPLDYSGASLLTVYSLDIAHPSAAARPISVAADGDTVYATATSLFVASAPPYGKGDTTQLHRFDITGSGKPLYLGSGSVPGSLVNRYALSEYDGELRAATTTGRFSAQQSSGVYVLDAATLAPLGSVTGLGPSERIYSVRYAGPLAYVVTFRQTDPLYVVDLNDPRHPRVAGELKITGYSDYLHDIGGGRLIGVGQAVDENGNGVVDGVQVSLFDTGDPSRPRLLSRVTVAGTPNETPIDPHAFLYWPPTGLLAVPLQSWNTQNPGVLVAAVNGPSLERRGVVTNPAGAGGDGLGVQRSLIVDGALWTLSGSGVRVSDPATLAQDAWIAFG